MNAGNRIRQPAGKAIHCAGRLVLENSAHALAIPALLWDPRCSVWIRCRGSWGGKGWESPPCAQVAAITATATLASQAD